jgi:hypothetical protein
MVGRPALDQVFAEARHTIYVVTNRRALTIGPERRQGVEPDQMPFLEKVPGRASFSVAKS